MSIVHFLKLRPSEIRYNNSSYHLQLWKQGFLIEGLINKDCTTHKQTISLSPKPLDKTMSWVSPLHALQAWLIVDMRLEIKKKEEQWGRKSSRVEQMQTFSWISTIDPIHICPDPDLTCSEKGGHYSSRKITSVPLQCNWNVLMGASYKASCLW